MLALYGCTSAVVALKPVRPAAPQIVGANIKLREAGEAIADAVRVELTDPLAALADYLAAAQSATARLKIEPHDPDALRECNFALSRCFSVIHDHRISPW